MHENLDVKDFQEPVNKTFWKYTIPTVAAMLVNGLYQVVDGVFVGQFVGAKGIAGINAGYPLIGVLLGLGMVIGMGSGAMSSMLLGEGNKKEAKGFFSVGLILVLILSIIAYVALGFAIEPFLNLQGITGETFEHAKNYTEMYRKLSVFVIGGMAIPFLLRNDGAPKLSTKLVMTAAVINIVLDYYFLAHLNMGLAGVALATSIAQAFVTISGIVYFFSNKAKLQISLSDFSFSFEKAKKIFYVGGSSFFMYIYMSFVLTAHNYLFIKYSGDLAVGAYGVIGYIVIIYYLMTEGVTSGAQPIISHNFGSKNFKNIDKALSLGMRVIVISGLVFVIGVNIFSKEVLSFFGAGSGEIYDIAILGIQMHIFGIILDGIIVFGSGYFQSIGLGNKSFYVSAGNMLIQIPFLYILPKLFGLKGIWLAMPLSNIVLALLVYFFVNKDLKSREVSPTLPRSPMAA